MRNSNVVSLIVRRLYRASGTVFCCLLLLVGGLACRTTDGPPSSGFASVNIQNHSVDEIVAATAQVFGADGYQGVRKPSGEMVFEKPASRGSTLAREGVAGSFYGNVSINRVKASVVGLSPGVHRLECKAYLVSGGSDPFFQDEVPLANVRKGPYQSLLDKVAKQLK